MQSFAKIERHESHYHCNESSDYEMYILGRFLASDVADSANGFVEALHNNKLKGIDGNLTKLDKENNIVIMSDLYSEQNDGGPYLYFEKTDLVEILHQWNQILNEKPYEIFLKKENGKINMTFK